MTILNENDLQGQHGAAYGHESFTLKRALDNVREDERQPTRRPGFARAADDAAQKLQRIIPARITELQEQLTRCTKATDRAFCTHALEHLTRELEELPALGAEARMARLMEDFDRKDIADERIAELHTLVKAEIARLTPLAQRGGDRMWFEHSQRLDRMESTLAKLKPRLTK